MSAILQTIKNQSGKPEYVLLPVDIYRNLKKDIDKAVDRYVPQQKDYTDFDPADFIKNKIALARMRAKITQVSLARFLKVSQAYISKIESDEYKVTDKLFNRVSAVIEKIGSSTQK